MTTGPGLRPGLIRAARQRERPSDCAMAIMGKASAAGRTKTRLSPPLRPQDAAALNTAFLRDMTENVACAAARADVDGYVAFGPPTGLEFFQRIVPEQMGLIAAWLPDFGECLFSVIDTLLQMRYSCACVLNSDSPTLPTAYLLQAAAALRETGDRMVVGPSTDGGYYFLGLKQAHRELFQDIAWSTGQVLAQTLAQAKRLNLPTVVLPTWYDVDDAASLRQLMRETLFGGEFRAGVPAYDARHTTAELSPHAGEARVATATLS